MVDLTTTYLGLKLKNPIVPSSSPLMQKVDNIRRLEDAGAAAVVLHSLFEEQIIKESNLLDHYLNYGTESSWEALTLFPEQKSYNIGPEAYLEHIRKVKAAVKIPVIASLNGVSTGGWIKYAQKMEQAGADALELNMYYLAADPSQTSAEVEQMYLDLLRIDQGKRQNSDRGQTGNGFHRVREFRATTERNRREQFGDLQSLLSTRLRSGKP